MSDLAARQQRFCWATARLIGWVYEHPGWGVRFGEAWRPPELVALYARDGRGSGTSVHPDRLAMDLLFDVDGVWQTHTEAYRPLGDYWKALDPLARWGGDFAGRPDGNHFSFTPDGRRA